jgi:hypothetical protein
VPEVPELSDYHRVLGASAAALPAAGRAHVLALLDAVSGHADDVTQRLLARPRRAHAERGVPG